MLISLLFPFISVTSGFPSFDLNCSREWNEEGRFSISVNWAFPRNTQTSHVSRFIITPKLVLKDNSQIVALYQATSLYIIVGWKNLWTSYCTPWANTLAPIIHEMRTPLLLQIGGHFKNVRNRGVPMVFLSCLVDLNQCLHLISFCRVAARRSSQLKPVNYSLLVWVQRIRILWLR